MIYPFVEDPMYIDFETADGIFRAYRLLRDKEAKRQGLSVTYKTHDHHPFYYVLMLEEDA